MEVLSLPEPPCPPSAASLCARELKSVDHPPPPTRVTVCGFLPLPSIVASPICTPTSSLSSPFPVDGTPISEIEGYRSSATSNSLECVLFSPPTWISTPPTPPLKLIRRSTASSLRSRPKSPFSPSASFPASLQHRGSQQLKRCTSSPTISGHFQAVSVPLLGMMEAKSTEQDVFYSSPPHNDAVPRSKSIFHLSGTDNEEETGQPSLGFDESPDGSWSDHSPFDAWEKETNKDALRKFHALKELLTTEIGYLMDLKAFVMVKTWFKGFVVILNILSRYTYATFQLWAYVPVQIRLSAARHHHFRVDLG